MIFHVTTVTCLFIVNKKEKEIQKKRNINSRKINKRKRKRLVLTYIITSSMTKILLLNSVFYGRVLLSNLC